MFLVWYGLYALAYGAAVVVSVRAPPPTARHHSSRATSPPHAGAQFRNRVHVTALAVWLALAIAVSALEAAPERSSLVLRACLRVARIAFALPKLKHALVLLRSRANQQALRAQHTQTSRAQSVIELLRYVRRYLGALRLRWLRRQRGDAGWLACARVPRQHPGSRALARAHSSTGGALGPRPCLRQTWARRRPRSRRGRPRRSPKGPRCTAAPCGHVARGGAARRP